MHSHSKKSYIANDDIQQESWYERFKWWSLHVLKIVQPIILGSQVQKFSVNTILIFVLGLLIDRVRDS